jgi:hypothetical protein
MPRQRRTRATPLPAAVTDFEEEGQQDQVTSSINQGRSNAWRGYNPDRWQSTIDVRDFIMRHATPCEGDDGSLVGPSARTRAGSIATTR